jgi:hypothetical protein
MAAALHHSVTVPAQSVDQLADRAWIGQGPVEVQIRLDGPDAIYLSYTDRHKRELLGTTVDCNNFCLEFHSMLARLLAKTV